MQPPQEIDVDGFPKRKLSRYMGLWKFEALLADGLYLPNVPQFEGDASEGLLGVRLRERMRLLKGTRYASGPADHAETLKWIHVSCWYDGVRENPLMWRNYGEGPESVMIESSAAKLERVYRQSGELYFAHAEKVTYHPEGHEPANINLPSLISRWDLPRPFPGPNQPDPVNLLAELFLKYGHYEGEREYRLVCLNRRHQDPAASPAGFFLKPARAGDLIDRVKVSPDAPEEHFRKIRGLCEKIDPALPVVRSEIAVRK
jgi:hypothetical protein